MVSRLAGDVEAREPAEREGADDGPDWQSHPSVNSPNPCPWCGIRALHEQHCKQICLACGWYRSCVD